MKRHALVFTLTSFMAMPAFASSDSAWGKFVSDVQAKCLAAAAPVIEDARAVVDPTGSEHYGLAILTGKAKGTGATISHICVYDKKTMTVELGSELSAETVKVDVPGSTKP